MIPEVSFKTTFETLTLVILVEFIPVPFILVELLGDDVFDVVFVEFVVFNVAFVVEFMVVFVVLTIGLKGYT